MSLFRSTVLVSVATVASRVLGFVRDVLIAAVLGAGPVADAFFVAFRIPNLVRRVLTEGGLNAVLVPIFLRLRAQGREAAALAFGRDSVALAAVVGLLILAVIEIAASPLVFALAAGYMSEPEILDLAMTATRLAAPFIAAGLVAAALSAILNGEGRFGVAAAAPLAVNSAMIVALLILGWSGLPSEQSALWLAGALSLSGALHLAVVAVAGRRLLRSPRFPRLGSSPELRSLSRIAGPALVAAGAPQLIVLAGAAAASFEPGAVSWFYYAERVFQLPLGFVGAAAGIVLLPELARASGEASVLSATTNRAIEGSLLIALPASVALVLLAPPIVESLFRHGAFDDEDSRRTAAILAGLGLGLPLAAIGRILSQSYFAQGNVRGLLLAATAATATAFAAAILLPDFQGWGRIGLSISLGFAVQAALLAFGTVRRGWWRPDGACASRLARTAVAAALMGIAVVFLRDALGSDGLAEGRLRAMLSLAGLCTAGAFVYAALAFTLGAWNGEDLGGFDRS